MSTFANITLIITAITTALISGLFYAWYCSVIPGLAKVSDQTYVETMQQINRAILNPLFFFSFMGTVFLLPLSTWLQYASSGTNTRFLLLLLASIIYLTGTFGVTMFGNVPLNDALDRVDLSSATAARAQFETMWNKLNTIRTVASFVALALTIVALSMTNDE